MIYSKKAIFAACAPFIKDLIESSPGDEWYSVTKYLDLHVYTNEETGTEQAWVYAVKWDAKEYFGNTDTSREMCVYTEVGELPEPTWEGLIE